MDFLDFDHFHVMPIFNDCTISQLENINTLFFSFFFLTNPQMSTLILVSQFMEHLLPQKWK